MMHRLKMHFLIYLCPPLQYLDPHQDSARRRDARSYALWCWVDPWQQNLMRKACCYKMIALSFFFSKWRRIFDVSFSPPGSLFRRHGLTLFPSMLPQWSKSCRRVRWISFQKNTLMMMWYEWVVYKKNRLCCLLWECSLTGRRFTGACLQKRPSLSDLS